MKSSKSKIKTDLQAALNSLEEVGKSDYFIPREGKNIIRILPWKHVFFFKATLHYGFQRREKGGGERAYPCLLMFGDKNCPVCDFREKLVNSDDPKKVSLAQRLRPVTKFYCNVLDRDKLNEGVKIYGFSMKMMRAIKGYLEDDDYGDITDPEEGRDIIIVREGTTFTKTSYEIRVKAKPSPIGYEGWEEELHDLEKEVVQKVAKKFLEKKMDELKKMLSGKPTKERVPEEEEEEDDEFEDEEEQDEELEESDEEDEVESDEEEEDDDEQSSKKKKVMRR